MSTRHSSTASLAISWAPMALKSATMNWRLVAAMKALRTNWDVKPRYIVGTGPHDFVDTASHGSGVRDVPRLSARSPHTRYPEHLLNTSPYRRQGMQCRTSLDAESNDKDSKTLPCVKDLCTTLACR